MGKLSTHVLDTAAGVPAAGMAFRLERIAPGPRALLHRGRTDEDGRCADLLTGAGPLLAGSYELHFEVAAYFRARGVELAEPPFLDVVTVRFGVAEVGARLHVPLLVSPWSYTTYRGS